jgi:hypothetical protein
VRAPILLLILTLSTVLPLSAGMRISLGYGMQLNSMLNKTQSSNLEKMILNQSGTSLTGITGTNAYSSTWSASGAETAAYPLVHLPEIRFAADWGMPQTLHLGFFALVSGFVPQTSAYYLGSYQLREGEVCSGIDYAKCPLAATNFVAASGSALYDAELRSHSRFMNLSLGVALGKKIATIAAGDLIVNGELGVSVQAFSTSSQFVASRCSGGGSTPCASTAQVRVVQSELKTAAAYALGPVFGVNLRYERPQASWFAELNASAVVLFSRLESSGYTSFVAAGTIGFSQTPVAQGVEAVQNVFAVLPSVTLRLGVRL